MARKRASGTKLVELLAAIPLFSGCSRRELASIAAAGKEVEHPAGHVICHEGKPAIGLHAVIAGNVRVEVGGRTRRRMGPGAFFGEIALLDKGPRTASVIAETPVTTFVLPTWDFRSLLKDHPTLAVKMLEEMAQRIRAGETALTH